MVHKPKPKLRPAPDFWPYDKEQISGLDAAQRDALRDWTLARQLLFGVPMVDETGEPRMLKHVEPDSDQERESRAALSRILRRRAPIDRSILNHLANLIDPNSGCAQELILKPRAAGHAGDILRDLHVGSYMADEVAAGTSVKAAAANAADVYGVAVATVMRAWRDYGKSRLDIKKDLETESGPTPL